MRFEIYIVKRIHGAGVTILDHLEPLERRLAAAGFPAMSPWWRSQVERFYRTPARALVLRVGRRGGKSFFGDGRVAYLLRKRRNNGATRVLAHYKAAGR